MDIALEIALYAVLVLALAIAAVYTIARDTEQIERDAANVRVDIF